MERIEHPKVFISYAWGTKEYQLKVLSFATSLVNDGIEVLLDKWEVSAGNDMNSFMERSVLDTSVSNVIILLDPNYTSKANQKLGGVGTETQIISQQVYAAVDQNKFIPVVFERNESGEICKPAYLLSRFHFDLSKEETYDTEYQNLIKTLYGVEIYKKPELGVKPSWVNTQIIVPPRIISDYDLLKENRPDPVKSELMTTFINEISQDILTYTDNKTSIGNSHQDFLNAYEDNRPIRSKYMMLLAKSAYYGERRIAIGDFLESTFNSLDMRNTVGANLSKIFIHELFLYTIAYLFKHKSFKEVGYLLGRTYFGTRPNYNGKPGYSYHIFYSGQYHTPLDNAMNARDSKNYYSGTAAYWISTLNADFCSKEDFVAADELCYNYSIYGNTYLDDWEWFPVTYVYDNKYYGLIATLANQLTSKEKLEKIVELFNFETVDCFISQFKKIEQLLKAGKLRDARYSGLFESAPLIGNYVKAEELGTVR